MAVPRLESSELVEGKLPRDVAWTTYGQRQVRTIVGTAKLGWRQQDLVPEGLKCGICELSRQTQAPEPVDKVVGRSAHGPG